MSQKLPALLRQSVRRSLPLCRSFLGHWITYRQSSSCSWSQTHRHQCWKMLRRQLHSSVAAAQQGTPQWPPPLGWRSRFRRRPRRQGRPALSRPLRPRRCGRRRVGVWWCSRHRGLLPAGSTDLRQLRSRQCSGQGFFQQLQASSILQPPTSVGRWVHCQPQPTRHWQLHHLWITWHHHRRRCRSSSGRGSSSGSHQLKSSHSSLPPCTWKAAGARAAAVMLQPPAVAAPAPAPAHTTAIRRHQHQQLSPLARSLWRRRPATSWTAGCLRKWHPPVTWGAVAVAVAVTAAGNLLQPPRAAPSVKAAVAPTAAASAVVHTPDPAHHCSRQRQNPQT
jgi:hypothetical protein